MADSTSIDVQGQRLNISDLEKVLDPAAGLAKRRPPDYFALFGIAATVAFVHILTNNRYGFHRDELQFLSDARHLDWGFVSYPPLTPFVERISMEVFGLSLVGLRLFSVLAQSLVIFVAGLMAWEFGGGRLAQFATSLAIALSPLPLFEGTEFQYTTFDYLWWVLAAYFVVLLLKRENPHWWLAVGAVVGLGLMTKYTMAFLVCGIVGGMLLTPARRFFISGWFWAGAGLALLICLPNFVWQVRHEFISYHFLRYIHVRDVGLGRTNGFMLKQFFVCTNFYAVPLWIAGLVCFFRNERYRMMAWMYLIPLTMFFLAKGLYYYIGAAYPMLIAMGAAASTHWAQSLPPLRRRVLMAVFFTGLAGAGLYACALVLPLASDGPLMRFALRNNDALREEIGWRELVRTVAEIRDSLPPGQQSQVGVLVGNYGEQGAIEILGPDFHLPLPISTTNSAWVRGYPVPPPVTLIVIGFSLEAADEAFSACRLAGHNGNLNGIQNEESDDHPDIFVCGSPRLPWPEFWRKYQNFG